MALFRKKNPTPDDNEPTEAASSAAFESQPDKARKWFEYARAAAETYNYDYALTCYANGIKFDPESLSAHEAMFEVGIKYCNNGGKGASSKELRSIGDSHPAAKFAAAEFAWNKDINNASLAVKALEAAVKAEQLEYGNWAANRVYQVIARGKKVSKSTWLQARELFTEVRAWDEAMAAGQQALNLDPTDNRLASELKDLSAQRAMDRGGYEKAAGKEGGFRDMIKDADKQRELIEDESISQGATAEERVLIRARTEYEGNPGSPDLLNKYAGLLRKLGDPESEELAKTIYLKGFKEVGEYRFRMAAGDIDIDRLRRAEREARDKAQADPSNDELKNAFETIHRERLALQADEFNERVTKYPTDRRMKFELGMVEMELERYEDAMARFQAAKDEPKLKVRAGYYLGKCFAAEGWHREAVDEYQDALRAMDAGEKDLELTVRYDLMVSLLHQASRDSSVELAREALEICSGIARKDITFRDIRARRKELDELIKELDG